MQATMSARGRTLLVAALLSAGALADPDAELPDAEFLEYLGSWEESDEEWMLFNNPADDQPETRSGPAADGEEPVEKDDED